MDITHPRCCGLDVHKKTVVACVITPDGKELRGFGTMTSDLLALGDWLAERQVSHVAMESTGVYWKPLHNLLEADFTVLVVNAQHIKAVPGRKTDMKDAEWIADLLRHGLLQGSYIPDRPQRELRELVRYRRSLIHERARAINRIEKLLEGANIKLAAVATDIMGVSGRAMLEALVRGTETPEAMADLARGRMRQKHSALIAALRGLVGTHQRLLLASHLRHLDFLKEEIAGLNEEVATRMRPIEEVLSRLDTIPGIGLRTAQDVVAEIGVDMSRFPTPSHLASWAKVSPGNHESAGKRKSGSTGHGNRWLRAALVEAAHAAARKRHSYLGAQYRRLAARRGKKRAALAVAHTLLVIIYQMLQSGSAYQELGEDHFDQRDHSGTIRRAVRRIERLGYKVVLEAA